MLQGKALESLLNKYLVAHSSRRINFLYWNHVGAKDNTLNFVNLTGKELTRINNGELIFRSVRVRKEGDWKEIAEFINTYIIDLNIPKAVYVIRVDFLVSYLKKIKFDPALIVLDRNAFGSAMCHEVTQPSDVKPICTIDTDIQSLVLIDQIYAKYRKLMFSDSPDWDILNILKEYQVIPTEGSPEFKFKFGKSLSMCVTDGLDIVARKFIRETEVVDPKIKLEQINMQNHISTVVSRFVGDDMSIITLRVHLQYFLKEYAKANKGA